jgi:hypothetical protein
MVTTVFARDGVRGSGETDSPLALVKDCRGNLFDRDRGHGQGWVHGDRGHGAHTGW